MTATAANLLGTCPTAGFAAEVYVAARMTNGYNRQSEYDAEALMGFVLTPKPSYIEANVHFPLTLCLSGTARIHRGTAPDRSCGSTSG